MLAFLLEGVPELLQRLAVGRERELHPGGDEAGWIKEHHFADPHGVRSIGCNELCTLSEERFDPMESAEWSDHPDFAAHATTSTFGANSVLLSSG